MRWLLWKDYRHNRLVVFAALAFLLGPYLIGLGVFCGGRWIKVGEHNDQVEYWKPRGVEIIAAASMYSIAISQISIALIGGNAIAGERVDRSSTFLYALPIRRRKLLVSKLLVALAITAIPWLLNAVVWGGLYLYVPILLSPEKYREFLQVGATVATTGLIFFCVSWFFSSFVPSPAFNVCAGLVTPIMISSGMLMVHWLMAMHQLAEPGFDGAGYWYWGICMTIALVSFALGTWIYLRRVEP